MNKSSSHWKNVQHKNTHEEFVFTINICVVIQMRTKITTIYLRDINRVLSRYQTLSNADEAMQEVESFKTL